MEHEQQLVERFLDAQEELVIQPSDLSLRTISSMVSGGAINLSPVFQRRERWSLGKQSALIESFLLNIPVPPVYLAEDDLGEYQVIDGKQRIASIHNFLSGELELRALEDLIQLNGRRFDDLPSALRNSLDMRPLRAVTLLRQSNPDLKYEVFRRLNTGGEILNDQEIRNVIYRGPLNDLIYELAHTSFLRDRLKITSDSSQPYKQMQDAEYVLRFLTLSETWQKFSGSLRVSMNNFMETDRNAGHHRLGELRRRFLTALGNCERLWGDKAFRRPEGEGWRAQTLAGMYDAQMLAVNDLRTSQIDTLVRNPSRAVGATRTLFEDRQFESAVRQGTNTPSRIVYRTSKMIEALQGAARES